MPSRIVYMCTMNKIPFFVAALAATCSIANTETNSVTDLGTVLVEGSALAKYRPEKVDGATFTGVAPEDLPTVVDTLTEDFIREKNPTDMNDLLRLVPGIETGGTSLLVRQPGMFSIRGMGGTEPAFDGVIPVGRGAGMFMDPFMMERVEVVKGPIAGLSGGAGAQQNNNGAGGAINMHLKGAHLDKSERHFQENTSVGNRIWRQRGMIDANEVIAEDKAIRVPVSFDFYSPAYANRGSQDGADPRQQYALAPSFVMQPDEDLTLGLKTMFVYSDSPSYIGIPVWNGKPAAGYDWYESSVRKDDRSKYNGIMVNPFADWQVNDDWLLKFGGAFMYSHMEQTTREPYTSYTVDPKGNPVGPFAAFCNTGVWPNDEKYMMSGFSQSRSYQKSFNLFTRSIYTDEDLPYDMSNTLMVQPDFYYREQSRSLGVSRYGMTVQDSISKGWVTLLGGIRFDEFVENSGNQSVTINRMPRNIHYPQATAEAWSPRLGLTVKPQDWLVFFGNVSRTETPNLGYATLDGRIPTDPWTAMQYEAGARVRALEKLWFSASYYDIHQKDMPVMEADYTNFYFDGDNWSRGVELSISGDVTDDWTMMAMYAHNLYTDRTKAHGNPARDFERTPRDHVTISTSYRLHGCDLIEDIVVGASYRYRSMSYATMRGAYVNENLKFDESHVFDINASVPFKKFGGAEDWYLTLGVRNLFGEKYFETSRHYYECFVGEPRTFEIGIRGEF